MPERIPSIIPGPDDLLNRLHGELLGALHVRIGAVTTEEAQRLRIKLRKWAKSPDRKMTDAATIADAIAALISGSERRRRRWFKRTSIGTTLQSHARQNARSEESLASADLDRVARDPIEVLGDGSFYIARLLSSEDLREESSALGHCLGGDSLDYYYRRLRQKQIELYSIRSLKDDAVLGVHVDEPVATIEYEVAANHVSQIKLKDNATVIVGSPYLPAIASALGHLRTRMEAAARGDGRRGTIAALNDLRDSLNGIVLVDGTIVNRDELASFRQVPVAAVLTGRVVLARESPVGLIMRAVELPIEVDGTDLPGETRSEVSKVKGTLIDRSVDVRWTELIGVCDRVEARNAITLELPKLEEVGNSLDVPSATDLRLPRLRSVGGSIFADSARAIDLPELTKVGGLLEAPLATIFNLPQIDTKEITPAALLDRLQERGGTGSS